MKSIGEHSSSSAALVFIIWFLRPTLCSGSGKERCSTKLCCVLFRVVALIEASGG